MKKYPDQWKIVLSAMQNLIPELEDISVSILHTKRLGIFFKTSELQRPWTADEMSDGTIQSLAILSSLADPRNFLTLIEEPENSIHPWILNVISEQFKITSKKQTVILTTHSQIIIDKSHPNDIWIFHKKDGETKIERLTDIDKTIKTRWENGEFKLSDLLESGYISQYVPGGIS
jgi:predicted ATPase